MGVGEDRFRALAAALGVDGAEAGRAVAAGDSQAMLSAFAAVAGGDVATAVEVLWASVAGVMPMVAGGMSPARRANVMRALAARLLVEADGVHRPGEGG